MSRATPTWYVPHSPAESLRQAAERSADQSAVVELLAEREYPDLERRRVEAIVSAGMNRVEQSETTAPRRREPTDERPRSLPDRHADPADAAYLTDDEFARLLAVAFERFGGNAFRPEVRDCAVDLFWNRSHRTVAVRTVTRPAGEEVPEEVITAVATGDATPTQGRNPSRVAAVTNTSFSSEAVAVAEANDVELYDWAYLARWLSKARIGRSLAGDVLEHGAKRDYDLDERVAEAPTPPASIREFEPFEISVATRRDSMDSEDTKGSEDAADSEGGEESEDATGSEVGEDSTDAPDSSSDSDRPESMATTDEQPEPGELGSLYADPDEDGDFGAFDRFADRLDEISEDE